MILYDFKATNFWFLPILKVKIIDKIKEIP